MATHPNNIVAVRAVWRRGWALMWAGRTSAGYEMLSGLKVSDLKSIEDPNHPDRVLARVHAVLQREPTGDTHTDPLVMHALVSAAQKGDVEARDLLLFGDLGVQPST